jgi:YVTN family beta-propeller protein
MKTASIIYTILLAFICNCTFAQSPYIHDRVYSANQVSNSVSVIDPSENKFLGEIKLGKPYPNVLSPLYKGQSLVHGLRFSAKKKMLAVVSIGSNAVTLISTETNKILKTIYVGRSPHEPTFTPDSKQIWVSVRGEAYISIIDVDKMIEIKQIPVADGPGMVAFSPDGKLGYVCSSFTAEVNVVNTSTYKSIKKIPVVSPFSPNIFTSPDGKWIAMTHKDVGKVTIINSATMEVSKVISTGAITNHVTFSIVDNKRLMLVTVGGENKVKIFDVAKDFELINTINVGALPHGLWASADGKRLYVGLEYADQVQAIDLQTNKVESTIQIGQSPQALVYADNAVSNSKSAINLTPLNDTASTQFVMLNSLIPENKAVGRLSIRTIGMADLVEQAFGGLNPKTGYTLALTKSETEPFNPDFEINIFSTDELGKYMGQSTGLIKKMIDTKTNPVYKHIILIENSSKQVILIDNSLTTNK